MKIINTLIVDDMPVSRELINLGIQKYNAQNSEFEINVVGEASTSEEGIEMIEQNPDIAIVFLDYNLLGKNGFHISRKYWSLAYIVTSSEREIDAMILGEKAKFNHPYMERVLKKGVYLPKDIADAIQQYVNKHLL